VSVTVHTDSVASALPELTTELEGELFFHAGKWPTATFESEAIERADENRYVATGELRIRDVSRAIEVPFTFVRSQGDDSARANGEITFKRLDFNVGLGEWKNTDWVGNEVTVRFDVALEPSGTD
jgi:polyisoprenoid-binding protein YceI